MNAEHLSVYANMKSLGYRVRLSQERVDRIRVAVAEDQFNAARRMRRFRDNKRAQRLGLARLGFWADLANAAEDALRV